MDKLTKYTQLEHLQKTNELVDEVNNLAGEIPQNLIYSSTPEGGKFYFRYKKPQEEGGGSEDVLLVGKIPLAKDCDSNSSGLLLGSESDDIDLIKNSFVHDLSSKVQDNKLIIEGYRGKGTDDTLNKFTVEIPVSKLAITGSYNDLIDVPELTEEEIVTALGYTPFNPTTGGDIQGNINLTNGGKYLINGEELESGINLLKRSKEYVAGDIAFSKDLKSPYHLKCIVAGTTSETEPEGLSSKLLNDEFEDGTVKWKVVEYVNHLENYLFVGSKEDLAEDKLHENMIVVDPEELINPLDNMAMVGATEELDGIAGLVPAPVKGSSNRYLSSDGTWKEISAPEVDLSNVAKLDEANTFTANNYFDSISLGDTTTGLVLLEPGTMSIWDKTEDQTYRQRTYLSPKGLFFKEDSESNELVAITRVDNEKKKIIIKNLVSGKVQGESITIDAYNKTIDAISSMAVNDSDGNPINTTYVKNEQIGNEANKLVQYTSDGHIMLPTGIEIY